MTDLTKRAVACKHWKWMPGMLALGHGKCRIIEVVEGEPYFYSDGYRFPLVNDFPDFEDAATLGCLLALVRQVWDVNHIFTRYSEYVEGGEWDVPVRVQQKGYRTVVFFKGATEVEALVAALEAAE